MVLRNWTNPLTDKSKLKAVVGVSLMTISLAACQSDDEFAADQSASSDGGLWTWSRPDAWYERSGNDVSPAAQPQAAAPQQQGSPQQQAGGVQMTTRTYEIEEVSPIDGRVTRRTVTETVPASQASAPTQPVQMSADGGGQVIIPANKLPQNALPENGFGAADQQNANYSGSVRGSMDGTVSAPVPAAKPAEPKPVVEAQADASMTVAAPVVNRAPIEPIAPPKPAEPLILVSQDAAGGQYDGSRPLLTSPVVAAAGRTSGSFDNDYLDLNERAATPAQRSSGNEFERVTQRANDFDVQIVDDYDAKWADLEFDGGARMTKPAAAPAGRVAAMPTGTMPLQNAGVSAAKSANIEFEIGSSKLTSSMRRKILQTVLAYQQSGGVIEVFGQAASSYNDKLDGQTGYDMALARAQVVANTLGDAGVDSSNIRVIVLGVTGEAQVDIVLR